MLNDQIYDMVDKEIRADLKNVKARISEKLFITLGEEMVQAVIPPNKWQKFIEIAEIERDLVTFYDISKLGRRGSPFLDCEELMTMFSFICDKCEGFCQYLMDEYNNAPQTLRDEWDLEELMYVAAQANFKKEKLSSHKKSEREKGMLSAEFSYERIQKLLEATLITILGEELGRRFAVERTEVEGVAEKYFKIRMKSADDDIDWGLPNG